MKPKHTVESIAKEILEGLENGTVELSANRPDLGMPYENHPCKWEWLIGLVAVTIAVLAILCLMRC